MSMNYTRKERDAINRAYTAICAASEATDWSTAHDLDAALKYERRERSSAVAAKALLAESWLEGFDNPDTPAKRVAFLAKGCGQALLIGAKVGDRFAENLRPEHRTAIEYAAELRKAAVSRELDKLQNL